MRSTLKQPDWLMVPGSTSHVTILNQSQTRTPELALYNVVVVSVSSEHFQHELPLINIFQIYFFSF